MKFTYLHSFILSNFECNSGYLCIVLHIIYTHKYSCLFLDLYSIKNYKFFPAFLLNNLD